MAAALSVLLLLGLPGSQASHYYGTVMTFTPKDVSDDGSVTVVCRYKLSFRSCTDTDAWACGGGDCGNQTVELSIVDALDGEWCQREGVMTRQAAAAQFELRLSGGDWVSGIRNGVSRWLALTRVDLRLRSDTGKPNGSPQTTVLPALRVASNCRRDFSLLAFDPDGDEVKCRFGDAAAQECDPCRPPSLLSVSASCVLTFRSSSSSSEGPYAVQMEMEDFPNRTITLVQSDGVETTRTRSDALSKIPIRFTLLVDPAVPACTDGLYLPRFLPPTPDSRAQLLAYVNQKLEVLVRAEATRAQVSDVFFSGPHTTEKQKVSEGRFLLSWTPSEANGEENHPLCFVVQAVKSSSKYQSELRCVVVTVRNEPPTTRPPSPPPTTTCPAPTQSAASPPPSDVSVQRTSSPEVDLTSTDSEETSAGKVVGLVFVAGLVAVFLLAGLWGGRKLARAQRTGI